MVPSERSPAHLEPLRRSQLGVFEVPQESRLDCKQTSESCTDGSDLHGKADGATLGPEELALGQEVLLGSVDDLVSCSDCVVVL